MADIVTVDDNDPRIQYLGSWFQSGSKSEYAGTTHGTRGSGTTASFNFTGTSVAVYGTIVSADTAKASVSTYSIDGSTPYIFAPTPGPQNIYKQQFYEAIDLPAGVHMLVISSIVEDSFFWLDFLVYRPSPIPSSTTSGAPSSSPSTLPATDNSSRIDAGPIVGGAFGGLALLSLAIFLIWHIRRRIVTPHTQNNLLLDTDPWARTYPGAVVPFNITENSRPAPPPDPGFGRLHAQPGFSTARAIRRPLCVGYVAHGETSGDSSNISLADASSPQSPPVNRLAATTYTQREPSEDYVSVIPPSEAFHQNQALTTSETLLYNGIEEEPPAYQAQYSSSGTA